jgi:hypothetical protein
MPSVPAGRLGLGHFAVGAAFLSRSSSARAARGGRGGCSGLKMTDSTVAIDGLPRPRRGLSESVLVEGSRAAVWMSGLVSGRAWRVRAGAAKAGLEGVSGEELCMRCGGVVRPAGGADLIRNGEKGPFFSREFGASFSRSASHRIELCQRPSPRKGAS